MTQVMEVGIRELKAGLSRYMRQVKAGATLVITERGKPVGRIVPIERSLEEKMQALVEAGIVAWNGERLPDREPIVVNRSSRTIADLLIEDRE